MKNSDKKKNLVVMTLDECKEQGMGLEYGAVVLGIVLHTDVPGMTLYLYSLYQLGHGVDTYTLHAGCLELLLVLVIELVAVVVALLDAVGTIDFLELAALDECAVEVTHTHRVAEVGLQLLHDVNNVVGSSFVHLTRVGIGNAEYVAGKLYYHALHAETDTKGGDVVLTGVAGYDVLALDTALTGSRTNDDTVHAFECLGYILSCDVLAVEELHLQFAVVVCSGL